MREECEGFLLSSTFSGLIIHHQQSEKINKHFVFHVERNDTGTSTFTNGIYSYDESIIGNVLYVTGTGQV
ncbi:hypothetical protein SUGI_0463410 [Cryptomeria japonica]|nr:hypothetical protein SUGI_0463410 [Cryptomeria japonica]